MKFGFRGLSAADTTDGSTHHEVEIRVACRVDLTENGKARITQWYSDNPGNRRMLETVLESCTVTHNVKDFRRVPELKVQAITPADFLNLLRN